LKTFRCDQRFENWKRLRAPGWPYFLRSRIARIARQQTFRLQRRTQVGVKFKERAGNAVANRAGLTSGPPPATFTRTSSLSAVPVMVSGWMTTARWVSSGK
jgi:hypothetical protein